jgi:hypothetical protein
MNYKWGIYVNIKGLEEYKINKGIDISLSLKEVWLLAFIVEIYYANKGIISIRYNSKKYVYVTDNLILNNLKYLDVKPRQLKAMLGKLCKHGLLSRYIENRNKRYLNVSQDLLHYWES